MVIERNADEVIVRIPVSSQNIERIQDAVDYFRYVELSAGFETPQEDVDNLAKEINKAWRKEYESRR